MKKKCNLNNFQSFNSTYETARGHIDFTLDAKKINFAKVTAATLKTNSRQQWQLGGGRRAGEQL